MNIFKNMQKSTESEKALEARLVAEVKSRNGVALKLTSQFHRGMPDRLVILPYRTIAFVELKSSGKKPTALQEKAMEQLRQMRFTVRVVDSTDMLNELLESLDRRLEEQRLGEAEFNERKKTLKFEYQQQRRREAMDQKIRRHIESETRDER